MILDGLITVNRLGHRGVTRLHDTVGRTPTAVFLCAPPQSCNTSGQRWLHHVHHRVGSLSLFDRFAPVRPQLGHFADVMALRSRRSSGSFIMNGVLNFLEVKKTPFCL